MVRNSSAACVRERRPLHVLSPLSEAYQGFPGGSQLVVPVLLTRDCPYAVCQSYPNQKKITLYPFA